MSQRILILADGFSAPSFNPRLRALCDYLTKNGNTIEVAVERIKDLQFAHSYHIHEYQMYTGSRLDWAVKNCWSLLTDWKNRRFARLIEQQLGHQNFDLVFCTTFHTFPLCAAISFAKKHKLPVILDLRDITEQVPHSSNRYLAHQHPLLALVAPLFQYINLRRRNRCLRKADAITTVSPWHTKLLQTYNPNTHLIYNGYDPDFLYPEDTPSDTFTITYCGKFFGLPMQNAEPLFEALKHINDLPYRLLIHTNDEGKRLLQDLAERYSITAHTIIDGYLPQEKLPELYHRSSILLVFTNKASEKTVHGMMTTKFFDALGVEKPVLCVPSDEECLDSVIQMTNAGISAGTAEEIESFIRLKYTEWLAKGFTRQPVINKTTFSRTNESKAFEDLFRHSTRI